MHVAMQQKEDVIPRQWRLQRRRGREDTRSIYAMEKIYAAICPRYPAMEDPKDVRRSFDPFPRSNCNLFIFVFHKD